MAEFVAYARALRREIDGFLAATQLRVAPALALVDCGCQPRHFVPPASLDAHTRQCHGLRHYEVHSSHKFFYQSCKAAASHDESEHTPQDDHGDVADNDSLVEPEHAAAVDGAAELAAYDAAQVVVAVKALATHAAALYAVVQPWRRVPRAFARLPLGDGGELSVLLKPKLERWIKAELARRQEADEADGDVDSELVEYMLGLLDHPEFCHPDLIALELDEFLGGSEVKSFVLALWKFVVIEIGIHVLPAVVPPDSSDMDQPASREVHPQVETSHATQSKTSERAPTTKRRRPTYRAKSTRAGPYDMVREILANSMAQLSESTGRELVAIPEATTQAASNGTTRASHANKNRTPEERWTEYTDALLVRDMGRKRESRERRDHEDYRVPHRRRSRSPHSRSDRRDRPRRSRSRSRTRSRSRDRPSRRHDDHRRDRRSAHRASDDRRSRDNGDTGTRYEDRRRRSRSRNSRL